MPRRKFPKKPEGVPLSAIELCQHDDVCTDILVDQTYYQTTIPKCKLKWTPLRGVDEAMIVELLHRCLVVEEDVHKATQELLQLPPLLKYHRQLDTVVERERLVTHINLYLPMYLPECRWEVTTTNRYTVSSHEASICARQTIDPGPIAFLRGSTVPLTRLEEDLLDNEDRAFSVMASTKREQAQIMLGPARFVNHDCMPNASLRPTKAGVEVIALRPIRQDEEITANYGGNYFGPDNGDCLCASCETLGRGGWVSRPRERQTDVTRVYRDEGRVPSEYLAMRRWLATQEKHGLGTRQPFDYVLTKRLLVHTYDRWARCQNIGCGSNFVQQEGYQVRKNCPRCERHLRIYGLAWPIVREEITTGTGSGELLQAGEHGRCGKGRWISEEVESRRWSPMLRANTLYEPVGESKKRTRQGSRMEAESARLKGDIVDLKFMAGAGNVRKSRRLR